MTYNQLVQNDSIRRICRRCSAGRTSSNDFADSFGCSVAFKSRGKGIEGYREGRRLRGRLIEKKRDRKEKKSRGKEIEREIESESFETVRHQRESPLEAISLWRPSECLPLVRSVSIESMGPFGESIRCDCRKRLDVFLFLDVLHVKYSSNRLNVVHG